ncbi:MAG: C69 family dipeptidase [Coriobacteriia bacterium]|nr:C69 family dipeptidase [Coriobacteriia bacterium]
MPCTGVYVGRDVCVEGTSLIGRSVDLSVNYLTSHIKVFEANHQETIVSESGYKYIFPKNSHRFICAPTDDCMKRYKYFSFAINDCNVSISATVTGYSPRELEYVDGGVCEDILPVIVGAEARSAKEGIEIIAREIEKYGSFEDNILMIADNHECWYMEIHGGHDYCAIKAPDDCVAVIGNEFFLKDRGEICSKGFENIPHTDKNLDVSHMRTWIGHKILSPSTIGDYSNNMELPLFYKPDKKVSLYDVFEIFRNRYEGTKYHPDASGEIRPISVENQSKVHVLQNFPDESICWFTPGPAEFAPFVPISNKDSDFHSSYTYSMQSYGLDDKSIASLMKQLNTLCCLDREGTSEAVRAYWRKLEHQNPSEFQKIAYEDTKAMIEQVMVYLMETNTTCKVSMDLKNMSVKPKKKENFEYR